VVARAPAAVAVQPLVAAKQEPPRQARAFSFPNHSQHGEGTGWELYVGYCSLDNKQRAFLQLHFLDECKAKTALINTVFGTHPRYLVNCLVPLAFPAADLLKKAEEWPGTNTGTPLLRTYFSY
jgi:hypothetical protein